MVRKLGFTALWLGFIAYVFLLSPPNQPGTFELVKNLSTGKWEGINPLVISLFNIMGVWPMIYSCLLFIDGRAQKIPAWPFATLSFGVGAFALLPYLALREPNSEFSGTKNAFIKVLDSRLTGVVLTVGTVILVTYGLLNGDWENFGHQWQTSRFIHLMSLDFCLLCLSFPALLGDDMARRNLKNTQLFWLTALIPLFGPLIYLCLRPSLPESTAEQIPNTSAPASN